MSRSSFPQPDTDTPGSGLRLFRADTSLENQGFGAAGLREAGMKIRILLSYHYYRDSNLDELFTKFFKPPWPEVFADSGAFSAKTQGAAIDIEKYADWLVRWRHLFTVNANLDVIGDADGTLRNQHWLEDRGLSVLPVFHAGEDWSYLERYLDGYPYIALGGIAGAMNPPMAWLVRCFQMAKGRSVFHGFGITTWSVLMSLPWYSVDSSSWGQGFRYGQVPVFDSTAGKFYKLQLGDKAGWSKHQQLISRLGFNWRDFAERSRNERPKIAALAAISYMKAEQWIRKRHGEIFIPRRDGTAPDLLVHLADANPARFGDAAQGMAQAGTGPPQEAQGAQSASGLRTYLADARPSSAADLAAADAGLKIHLAEHGGGRGGIGDTTRMKEVIDNVWDLRGSGASSAK